jgi:hypothetical protein
MLKNIALTTIALFLILAGNVMSEPQEGEQINWYVISRGGTHATSTNYILDGTLDQTAIGFSQNDTYTLNSGFWQVFEPGYLCGDANNDGDVNVSDAIWIVNFIFISGPEPDPWAAGEVNCDGSLNVSDVIWIANYVFGTGSNPCDSDPPYPDGDGIPDC